MSRTYGRCPEERVGDPQCRDSQWHADLFTFFQRIAMYCSLCAQTRFTDCYLVFNNLTLTEWASGLKRLPHKTAD